MNIDVDAHVIKDDIKHSGIRRHQKAITICIMFDFTA